MSLINVSKIAGFRFAKATAIAAFLFSLASGARAEDIVMKTAQFDPSVPRVVIDGVTFHSQAFGDPSNPVLVVVHGGPGGDYRGLLPLKALSDKYFVVFYDQRGTGLSPRVDAAQLTFDNTVADLDRIIDHYAKGRKVSLLGHSFGAMVVSPYLGKHPEKVSKAILIEPGFLTTETAQLFYSKMAAKMMKMGAVIKSEKEKPDEKLAQIVELDGQEKMDYLFSKHGTWPDGRPFIYEYYCNGQYAVEDIGWRNSALSNESIQDLKAQKSEFAGLGKNGPYFNFTKDVKKFGGKVLFLTSECNTITGVKLQKKHMKEFKNADMEVVKGVGHEMFQEDPAVSVAAVRKFLDK